MRTRGLEPPRAKGPPGPKPGAYASSATSADSKIAALTRQINRRARPRGILDLPCGGHERSARIRALAAKQGEAGDQDDEGHHLVRPPRLRGSSGRDHDR